MPEDKEKNVNHQEALKAVVLHTLSGDVHPDQRATLEIWLDQNQTDEEKDARLTDDEYVEKHGKTRAQAAADDASATPPDKSTIPATAQPEGAATDEPESDTGGKPKSGTKK